MKKKNIFETKQDEDYINDLYSLLDKRVKLDILDYYSNLNARKSCPKPSSDITTLTGLIEDEIYIPFAPVLKKRYLQIKVETSSELLKYIYSLYNEIYNEIFTKIENDINQCLKNDNRVVVGFWNDNKINIVISEDKKLIIDIELSCNIMSYTFDDTKIYWK